MIKEKDIYSKLTPSAEDELSKIADDFKSDLLDRAHLIAIERQTANKEISLVDILEANLSHKEKVVNKEEKVYKRRRLAYLASFSGAIYAVLGILIYMIQNKVFSFEKDLGLVIAALGILISLMTFLVGQLRLRRDYSIIQNTLDEKRLKKNTKYEYEIVDKWRVIEKLAFNVMSEDEKDNQSTESVSFLIKFLAHKVADNEEEYFKIRHLLKIRNKIVHDNYTMSEIEAKEYLSFADQLILRLEKAQRSIERQSKNKITVLSAIYGTGKHGIDVTSELKRLIKNNKLEFIANNELAGDPDVGTPKKLDIVYEINGKKVEEKYKEGDKVVIE